MGHGVEQTATEDGPSRPSPCGNNGGLTSLERVSNSRRYQSGVIFLGRSWSGGPLLQVEPAGGKLSLFQQSAHFWADWAGPSRDGDQGRERIMLGHNCERGKSTRAHSPIPSSFTAIHQSKNAAAKVLRQLRPGIEDTLKSRVEGRLGLL